jgi:predicted  nucleic acid-binding Zn-ribbon protein
LTPSDLGSLGLSGALGQLGAVGSVFGSQAAVEVTMKVAKSDAVRNAVDRKLNLMNRLGKSRVETLRWLDNEVDVTTLRGGIIEIDLDLRDADLALDVISAYTDAVRSELAIVAKNQTKYKRKILIELVNDASDDLKSAQAAYDSFRLKTRYSSPESALAGIGDRIPRLEDALLGKKVELNTARKFATDDNMLVRQLLSEIQSLDDELRRVRSISPSNDNSLGQVVENSTKVEKLQRDLDVAQTLYDNYSKFLQGTPVEVLTATANIRILEPPHIDAARQYNFIPLSIAAILFLLSLAVEFYLMRPPLEARELS